jgi:cytochrome c556
VIDRCEGLCQALTDATIGSNSFQKENSMRLKLALAVVALGAGLSGIAIAADDPIAARQDLMEKNQDAAKIIFGMAQGKVPYDAAQAGAAAQSIVDDMAEFVTLFPEGSDKGDTSASPAIWENMDDFKAMAANLATDAQAAVDAAPKGLDAFVATLAPIGQDCGGCHEKYRIKR